MIRTSHIITTAIIALAINAIGYSNAHGEGVTIAGGPARVIDGDTIALRGVRLRLHAIDAPEAAQTCQREGQPYECGTASTRALQAMAEGRDLLCEWRDTDRHRRLVAECWPMDSTGKREGESINAQMVRSGHAIAYRKYSAAFIDHEREAREGKRGMWAGEFQQPESFRHARKEH